MIDPAIQEQMRSDWNRRAREDAKYYVAFGRREQDDEEFFATAAQVVRGLRLELRRLPAGVNRHAWRALEIGCGPGRILRPMSEHFGEIHGVDVSGEMIRMAREKLEGIPHAHVHTSSGSDLRMFADDSFEFVYSYAVFQHIPSREVVLEYLLEARRVLKTGGILRCQINGLPETAPRYDTWNGVRFSSSAVAGFAREHDFQLLDLEGISTQYMWTTWRKQPDGWAAGLAAKPVEARTRIRRITNATGSEPVAPTSGRFSSIALWVEGLPPDADLNHIEVRIGGRPSRPMYLGPRESDGLEQLNVALPPGLPTGLQPVELAWFGSELGRPGTIRVIPAGPLVPRILSVADGINLLSGTRIGSGAVKVTLEEAVQPEQFQAFIAGQPLGGMELFCTDPLPPRYELNFELPGSIPKGPHHLEMVLGRRRFSPVPIEIV